MSVFKNLKKLHDQFGFKRKPSPELLEFSHMKFRLKFIEEEFNETIKAYDEKDIEEVIDGLIDIMYVAAGTLDLMGVDGQKHWAEVHRANLAKRVVSDPTTSKRGFGQDLEKPADWVGPNHTVILEASYDKAD